MTILSYYNICACCKSIYFLIFVTLKILQGYAHDTHNELI
jgi:hypothetical protein